MNSMTHERIINAYLIALEAGDLENQNALLAKVLEMTEDEGGPRLASVLWEIEAAVGADLERQDAAALLAETQADAARVLALAGASFTTPVAATRREAEAMLAAQDGEDEAVSLQDPPPLTLGDLAARLRSTLGRMPARVVPSLREIVRLLESDHGREPVEQADLSERGAGSLLERIGFPRMTAQIKKQFHEALISLSISHEQELRMTAARRSRARRKVFDRAALPASPVSRSEPDEAAADAPEDQAR